MVRRLVIDTETTGLSPQFNKTLTVGLLLIDVEKDFLDILDQSHIFIKHQNYNLNPEATAVHNIDIHEHHRKAVEPEIACNHINDFLIENELLQTKLVGHNISFDRGFLKSLSFQANAPLKLHDKHDDTMWMWKSLQRKNKVPDHLRATLQTVADFFDIDHSNAHDALADCKITAKVYWKLLNHN